MCRRCSDDTELAPLPSPNSANSAASTAERLASGWTSDSEPPRPLPPKLSASGWSRLAHALSHSSHGNSRRAAAAALTQTPQNTALDAGRGAPSRSVKDVTAPSAAALLPAGTRQRPSTAGESPRWDTSKDDGEPALLLLPDGSVQIVCASQPPSSARSNRNFGRKPVLSVRQDLENDDSRPGRPTRASDVLRDHPGCQVGSLTSSHAFLRPQQALKPGHVYFLQPPLALPAPSDYGTDSGNYDAGGSGARRGDFGDSGSTALLAPRDACNEDDDGEETPQPCLEDVIESLVALDRHSLSPSPNPSLYRTPCACCNGGHHPTTSNCLSSHSSHSLNHAHSLPPSASAAMRPPSASPLMPPVSPPSPFANSPLRSCLPIGRHSRPQENFSTFPENTDFGFDHAAAHAFASSAAQESCSSHLIHRGWCTASRGTHLPAPPSASGHYNCNSSSACGVVKSYSTSFEVNSIGCSGFSSSSTGSSSGSSSSSSSKYTISHARGSFVAVDDVPEKGQVQRHSRFRVRGRAVVTVEDMVFGRGETTLA